MKTVIKDLPILDLREISREEILEIELVEDVRTVILNPENVESFMRIPRVNVRSHLIVKPDETLTIGQIEFNDDYLKDYSPNTNLVLLGHAFIDGFSIPLFLNNIKNIRVYGQILYSDLKSTGALLARLERLQGQLLPMPRNAIRWIGPTYLDNNILDLIAQRDIVSIGPITIDPNVSINKISKNIHSLVQIGEINGEEKAVCALISVCKMRLGPHLLTQN